MTFIQGTYCMGKEAEEFYNNILIAVDMVRELEDRQVIYAAIRAAKIATMNGDNPRKLFMRQHDNFDHIAIDWDFKNWEDD